VKVQKIALIREVSSSINQCKLTHLNRQPINIDLAHRQHLEYERQLLKLGFKVIRLSEEPDLPDAVFVEDTAVVLDELAVITRPGAISRRKEIDSIATALKYYRQLSFIEAPGHLEGGDVLMMDKHIYVGQSNRSNREGIRQFKAIVSKYGYRVKAVPLSGCLHLKSAVTHIADDALLVNSDWVDPDLFTQYKVLEIDGSEPYAANALRVDEKVIYPLSYPKTSARIQQSGIRVINIDVSEFIKAEGAVTCCSILFNEEIR
jgi:dimethylargininase